MTTESENFFARHWRSLSFLLWLAVSAFLILYRQPQIHWFALGDTDDNMRLMQVRALLNGQGWYDLRNYHMNPPVGANIHWTHLVDLPIAALILLTKPFVGGAMAEKIAVSVAPLLPLGVVFAGLGLTARRLVAPAAALFGALLFLCMITAMTMFFPLRIDHHGWQLAFLTVMLAGLADPVARRGGLTVGVATALSLVIGMETLPWMAVAGAGIVLRWLIDPAEGARVRGYGVALGIGVVAGFFLFASNDNWALRCDALTPVWVSVMVAAAAGLIVLPALKLPSPLARAVAAGVLGAALLAFLALAWPDCIGRPEQVSPELQRLWLDNISEAKPIYTRNWASILSASAALIGMAGTFWQAWSHRDTARGAAWATIGLMSLGSVLMLVWQARVAPAALTFSVPGAVALAWHFLPRFRSHKSVLVRTLGTVAAFVLISGLGLQYLGGELPDERQTPRMKAINRANATCPTIPALHPIALMPKATILTFVDMGPRLITMTHHNAIAGPYHRNGDAILDVHKAFRGTASDAREVMRRHGATLLLLCPNMSESTIYKVQNPKGFYMQLVDGKVPAWLEPVALPERSPFKLWRMKG